MDGVMARQAPLNLTLPDSVAVVGCGGVGSWTAYLLALAGVKKLWLFDSDTISDHNLNRIPLPPSAVGKNKAVAVAEWIRTIRPDCEILPMGNFSVKLARTIGVAKGLSYVIATTDTLASRRMVQGWAAVTGVTYQEASAEGEFGSATGSSADWSTPEENQPGYASVPVWCAPCVSSALIVVSYVVHGLALGNEAIRIGFVPNPAQLSGELTYYNSSRPLGITGVPVNAEFKEETEDVPF